MGRAPPLRKVGHTAGPQEVAWRVVQYCGAKRRGRGRRRRRRRTRRRSGTRENLTTPK